FGHHLPRAAPRAAAKVNTRPPSLLLNGDAPIGPARVPPQAWRAPTLADMSEMTYTGVDGIGRQAAGLAAWGGENPTVFRRGPARDRGAAASPATGRELGHATVPAATQPGPTLPRIAVSGCGGDLASGVPRGCRCDCDRGGLQQEAGGHAAAGDAGMPAAR